MAYLLCIGGKNIQTAAICGKEEKEKRKREDPVNLVSSQGAQEKERGGRRKEGGRTYSQKFNYLRPKKKKSFNRKKRGKKGEEGIIS